jgi:hypothetical protein
MDQEATPMTLRFPSDWPENCPPADALDADGTVYRLVRHEPPQDSDLATHRELGRLPQAPSCLRCGISVFRELRDAVHQRQVFPKLGNLIAKTTLQADHGKTRLTEGRQPTHTTWWAYAGVNRASLFAVLREES